MGYSIAPSSGDNIIWVLSLPLKFHIYIQKACKYPRIPLSLDKQSNQFYQSFLDLT